MELFIGVTVFILGMLIGSFLNVCIYRVPLQKSIVTSPSSCTSCGARLTALDLVPVFSFLFLRGRCRHCKSKISIQYPIVEALTAVLFTLLYVWFGLNWNLPVYMALVCLLIVISLIDLTHKVIPNGLIIAGLVVGAIQLLASIFTPYFDFWFNYVIGFFAGGVPLLLIALFCNYVLKKDAMGGGDIKLMAFAGLIIGWKLTISAYVIGIVAGAIVGVALIAAGKKSISDEIPFGPFLSLGILVSLFFGQPLIDWYLGLI